GGGDAVALRVAVGGAPGVARTEQQGDGPGPHQLVGMGEEVLGPVVLVVAPRVVLGLEPLVAQRDLPHDGRPSRRARDRRQASQRWKFGNVTFSLSHHTFDPYNPASRSATSFVTTSYWDTSDRMILVPLSAANVPASVPS